MDDSRIAAIDLFGVVGLPVKDSEMPPPAFAIAWDPSLITPEQYAELIEIIGDMVRANGASGIRRVAEHDYELKRKGLH